MADGRPLRLARHIRSATREQLAAAIGKSPQWIEQLTAGRRPIPARTLPLLAAALQVPVEMLTGAPVHLALGPDGWMVTLVALTLSPWRQSPSGDGYGYRYRQRADGSLPVQTDRAGWCVRGPGGEQVEGPEIGAAGEAAADAAARALGWSLAAPSGLPAPAEKSGLRVDPRPCEACSWEQPCPGVYSGAHACSRGAGHAGRCVCAQCGGEA